MKARGLVAKLKGKQQRKNTVRMAHAARKDNQWRKLGAFFVSSGAGRVIADMEQGMKIKRKLSEVRNNAHGAVLTLEEGQQVARGRV